MKSIKAYKLLCSVGTLLFLLAPPHAKAQAACGFIRPLSFSYVDHRILVGADNLPSISADGLKVAFASYSSELVPPPSGGFEYSHIFLHDVQSRVNTRLTPANTNSALVWIYTAPLLSGDGQTVACRMSLLRDGVWENSVWGRRLSSGSHVIASAGLTDDDFSPMAISSNGAVVVFPAQERNAPPGSPWRDQLYAYNFLTQTNRLVTVAQNGITAANRHCYLEAVSADGRWVVFTSDADNLVSNDLNGLSDVFVRDLLTGSTILVSANTAGTASANGGSFGPATITSDGRRVAFFSYATNISLDQDQEGDDTDVYLRDLVIGSTRLVSWEPLAPSLELSYRRSIAASADARFVVYDLFYFSPSHPHVGNLYIADTQERSITLISLNASAYGAPRISADGTRVFFSGFQNDGQDNDLTPGRENLYRWDRSSGEACLITPNRDGTSPADNFSLLGGIGDDGQSAAMLSSRTNLVFGDDNQQSDAFLWNAGSLPRLSIARVNNMLIITWPATSPAAVLEIANASLVWTTVPGPITEENGYRVYRHAIVPGVPLSFFRLRLL